MEKELCCGRASCLASNVCCNKEIICVVHNKSREVQDRDSSVEQERDDYDKNMEVISDNDF